MINLNYELFHYLFDSIFCVDYSKYLLFTRIIWQGKKSKRRSKGANGFKSEDDNDVSISREADGTVHVRAPDSVVEEHVVRRDMRGLTGGDGTLPINYWSPKSHFIPIPQFYREPQPLPGLSPKPNPWLDVINTTRCNHGCEIAKKETRAYHVLYHLITGLNAGVDRVFGPVHDAKELEFRATSFTKTIIQNFDDIWYAFGKGKGREADSKDLATSLASIGTDCLLMEEDVNVEGKLKMAAAIAGMVHYIEEEITTNGRTLVDEMRKWKDVMGAGEREITSFFNKRINCGCLRARLEALKDCQKMGICDCCRESFELKKLMQCSKCRHVQVRKRDLCNLLYCISLGVPHPHCLAKYCSKLCQESHWSEHK
jgi:hypothetical protein